LSLHVRKPPSQSPSDFVFQADGASSILVTHSISSLLVPSSLRPQLRGVHMADRVRDAEDVDHGDRGYQYPLGHVLNDWDVRPDASPPGTESVPRRAWHSTREHRVVRVAVRRPSGPSPCSPGCLGGPGLPPRQRLVPDRSSPAVAGWVARAQAGTTLGCAAGSRSATERTTYATMSSSLTCQPPLVGADQRMTDVAVVA
jgi:hypothetical protein